MKISTACEEFLAYKRLGGAGKLTLKSYRTDILMFEAHVLHAVGPRAGITHFTTAHVLSWFEHLQSRDLARKTLACHQTALREFAKWGLRRRYWREDPMLDVPIVAYPKTLPRPFSPEERNALMALELPLIEIALRAVLYHTGLRDAAICAIRLRDLHGPEALTDGRKIPARVRTVGKGNKESVKALHPKAWAAIEAYVERRAREDRVPEAPLFAKRDGSAWTPRMIQQRVHAWGVAAKVDPCVPHRFRHTFATNLLEQTNDVRLVQEALDHASLATTQIYTLVVNSRLEAAMLDLAPYAAPAAETLRTDYRDQEAPAKAPPGSPST